MQHHVDDAGAALYINDPKRNLVAGALLYAPPISEQVERLKQM